MRWIFVLAMATLLLSCKNMRGPDVSRVAVDLKLERFDEDFFHADSNNLRPSLQQLAAKYPGFFPVFMNRIINADQSMPQDSMLMYVRSFLTAYRPVFDSSEKEFKSFEKYRDEVADGFRHVKYYFPNYALPKQLITFIGPLDGYGDILTDSAAVVGLQHHIGSDFSLYDDDWVVETYPKYLTQRFNPQTISVNAAVNIVNDMYPENKDDKTLLEQMIDKGKRLYLVELFLPDKEPHHIIGYTKTQYADCMKNERMIWDLFIKNNYLQVSDPAITKTYVGESPRTQELGEAAPGNIGAFTGWQIVRKYMDQHPETKPEALMVLDNNKLYEAVKYKP